MTILAKGSLFSSCFVFKINKYPSIIDLVIVLRSLMKS